MTDGGQLRSAQERWRDLLEEHSVLTLATQGAKGPWTAPLYFAPDPSGRWLWFLSSPRSRHGLELAVRPDCAAALHTAPGEVAQIRGAQLVGTARPAGPEEEAVGLRDYLRRFPQAAAVRAARPEEVLYRLTVLSVKITDNRMGFGWKCELDLGSA